MSLSSILDVGLGDDVARYGFLSPFFYCFDFVSTVPVAGEVLLVVLLFLCSALHALIPELYEMAKAKFLRSPDVYVERSISVHLSTLVMGMVGNRNALLQNAILFYLYHNFWRSPLSPSVWKDKASLLLLVDPLRNSWEERYDSPFRVSSFEDSDDAYCEDVHWRSRRELERYIVVRISTDGSWVPVSKDGVEMTYNRKRENVDGTEGVLRTVILRAKGNADAAARIEAFLNSALEYYIKKLPSVMNEGRVFLEMQPSLKERDGSVHVRFKRYPLADDKTFDTLFFPEKSKLLSLVDDFIAKKGRFAIDGFPHKLGFLLYGPPGSGKTAFVKALAAYTGRHVVSVNLSFLHSNQDLYDIFLNREYQCIGESDVTIFGVEDVIFLLDNVDASRSLVRSRVRKRYVRKCRSRTLTASEKDESARLCGKADGDDEKVMVTVSSDSDGDNDSNNDDEGGGSMKNVSDDEDVGTAGGAAFCDKNVKIFNQLMLGAIDSQSPAESSGAWAVSPAQDKLVESSLMKLLQSSTAANLSGLLNVLDGAVDSPGRIVVMITKNPERLDPALVRPGRFSHKLHLDYMQMPALLSMLGLHFGTVDVGDGTKDDGEKLAGSLITMYAGAKIKNKATQLPRLSSADTERVRLFISALEKEKSNSENERSEGFRITPAEIESLCTVSTSLDEFLNLFKSYLTNNSGSNSSNNNNRKENEE